MYVMLLTLASSDELKTHKKASKYLEWSKMKIFISCKAYTIQNSCPQFAVSDLQRTHQTYGVTSFPSNH